jgi:hypothetical protein
MRLLQSVKRNWELMFVVALLALAAAVTPRAAQSQTFSDYLENKLVDHIFRGQSLTAPATIYVGLSTTACSDSSFGTEVSGNGYARVAVTSALANWAGTQSAGSTTASTGTGGQTSNNAAISFTTPTGSGWGTVTHWHLSDASSSGNLLFCAALTSSKTINAGDTVSFAIGALTVTLQ